MVAANRRMEEELGIPQGTCELKEIDSFIYFQQFDGLSEYEFDHVIVGEYEGEVLPNQDEIERVRWVTYEQLSKELMENPEHFAAWFLIAAPKVLKFLNA